MHQSKLEKLFCFRIIVLTHRGIPRRMLCKARSTGKFKNGADDGLWIGICACHAGDGTVSIQTHPLAQLSKTLTLAPTGSATNLIGRHVSFANVANSCTKCGLAAPELGKRLYLVRRCLSVQRRAWSYSLAGRAVTIYKTIIRHPQDLY